ncbi:MAG: hypothetical protein Q9208_008020 [Pyrenodesmia sp. 3 TL-2023]
MQLRLGVLRESLAQIGNPHTPTGSLMKPFKPRLKPHSTTPIFQQLLLLMAPTSSSAPTNFSIRSGLWDLAGVRILTYFPDDGPRAALKVKKLFPTLASNPLVKDGKRTFEPLPGIDRNVPDSEEQITPRIAQVTKGRFREVSRDDDVVHNWKHYGYLAVHFHVDVGEEMASGLGQGKQAAVGGGQNLWKSRVEIQITTVVMHAWSEVEHDIIYKNPKGLPPDGSLDRMIDAVNGLSITSEILLQQLQRTIRSLEGKEDRTL